MGYYIVLQYIYIVVFLLPSQPNNKGTIFWVNSYATGHRERVRIVPDLEVQQIVTKYCPTQQPPLLIIEFERHLITPVGGATATPQRTPPGVFSGV